MKKACARKLQELDKLAIEKFNIKSLDLMETAGFHVAEAAVKTLEQIRKDKVAVICGKGNNGGDGFVCARHLIDKGVDVRIFLIAEAFKLKGDALINYNLLKEKQDIYEIPNLRDFEKSKNIFNHCNLFIDAIFGIGVNGQLKEPFRSVIKFLNDTGKPIVSVDVPSGLDATTGKILGECIKAERTVTFVLAKTGFFINEGPNYCGEIIVVDIGVPKELVDRYSE